MFIEEDYYNASIYEEIKEFYSLYKERPIKDNMGGMLSPHLFNTWFVLKKIKPKLIIESGVWKGLGTWIIEKALPEANIISIDIDFSNLMYKSKKAVYLNNDIKSYNWNNLLSKYNVDKEDILIFLDDHQNFLERLSFIYNLGIKKILYEDNYPSLQGDSLSPKKILSCNDFILDIAGKKSVNQYSYYFYEEFDKYVESYYELPPIFKLEKTRWGDVWDDILYPTKKSILDLSYKTEFSVFYEEAAYYTWICYITLKK